ncbi:YfiR family protein [Flavitalea sp. BT771]|uniref:YfiR family protein n=1 Tax=Flavitalea sp. BT771 TaxID=3063329 RepID=UPI0026E30187|nr:YfiR family protein [Flavitalea sp. BT771]MDO6432727.1 YfiR family protein [Flavitalea sp. BT771]MDV6221997.1 YfiR family protein [Flavitalea sp. BT771]
MSVVRITAYRFLSISLLLAYSMTHLSAQSAASPEYEIKAVFLFNFSQFVQWPAHSFPAEQAPLVIGILGEDPFGSYLKETVLGEKVNGHPILVQHYNTVEEIKTCHILYINLPETRLDQVVESLKGHNTLTVSDAPYFLQHGGMIRFFTRNNKIQLKINLEPSKEANLVISSKLLRLAEIYSPVKNN